MTGQGLGEGASALVNWMDRQYRLSAAAMLQSISAVHLVKERPVFGQTIRPAKGSVLASPALASYDPDPDYFFHWLRDSAIVIDAVGTLIADGTYAKILARYNVSSVALQSASLNPAR